jgi:hypothetical protein
MSELAPPLSRSSRAVRRLAVIEQAVAQVARLQSQVRLELATLALEDTPFGLRAYLCDELALALAESPGVAQRMIEDAHLFRSYPAVVARVGLPLCEGGWSLRHADAILSAIVGIELSPELQQQVVDLVVSHPDARTPHQIRQAAQAAVMVLDPAAAERRLAKAKANCRVVADSFGDGSGSFWATGTTGQVAMVMASIDALAGPKQPGDDRTLDQRRFDAFMDLICGRVQPGQWQAVVVVTLETLEGTSDQPAEIPGFGLISAGEARDLATNAEVRRAVVDGRGELVAVDGTVHRPDLPEPLRLDPPHPDLSLSHELEPEPLDRTPQDPAPHEADLAWLRQHDDAVNEPVEALVAELTSDLEARLRAMLDLTPTRFTYGPDVLRSLGGLGIRRFDHGPSAGPPDRTQPPEPDPPPDSARPTITPNEPEEPDPPSIDDLDWAERTQDRDAQDALEPPPRYQRESSTRSGLPPCWSSWTRQALNAVHARLLHDLVDGRTLTSTAYALPPRLARFVKHRDLACSFPGCRRLARDSQNDHLIPWPRGASDADNIDSKCTHHHQAKTHGGFTTVRLPSGSIRWTTPLGRSYLRNPRPLLRGF